jgi:hypothetical protein
MQYSIHGKSLAAKKARILINALIDCARSGIKPCAVTKKMLWGLSLYLEVGHFARDDWKTYPRASDAAKQLQAAGDKEAKRNITFEHARPLNVMYQMLLDERATLTLDRVISAGPGHDRRKFPHVETRVYGRGCAGAAIRRDSVFRFQSAGGRCSGSGPMNAEAANRDKAMQALLHEWYGAKSEMLL